MQDTQTRTNARSLALFAGSTFFFWASLYIYVPILTIYAQQEGASLTMVGLIAGAYGMTQLVLRIPLGVWSDRIGRRKPFIAAGLLTAALGSLGFIFSPDPWLLFASRALTGVSASAWVAFTVLFSSYYPPARAVRAMSLITFVNGVAQLASTFAGGWLAQLYGWDAPFYVGAVLGLIGYLCTLGIHEEARPKASPMSLRNLGGIATVPLLLAVSVVAILGQYALYVTAYAFTPLFAAQLGASRGDQGTLATVMLITYTLVMPFTSWFAERIGDKTVVALGMLATAISIFITPFIASLPALAGAQALLGLGRGLSFPVLMGLSIRAVPQHQRATAMGFFQAVYAIGMFIGPVAGGPIAERFGLDGVFYSTTVICLAAVLLAGVTIPQHQAAVATVPQQAGRRPPSPLRGEGKGEGR